VRKFRDIQDVHELEEIKEIVNASDGFIYCNDSGAKDSNEHHAQLVCVYLPAEDVIVRFVISVDLIASTTGAAYDKSKAQTFAELGIDERKEIGHASDTCSSIIGINRAQPGKSKGMNALTAARTGNNGVLVIECVPHGLDLVLRYGMLAMCGKQVVSTLVPRWFLVGSSKTRP
jgi:hypothetical protein